MASVTKGVYFNGKLITLPGAYSSVESTMTATRTGAGAKVVALLGECTGGEPGALQLFSEPNVAKKVLKSGDLLKAAQKAWNPVSATKDGVELGGAYTIACIRTNQATKGVSKIEVPVNIPASVSDLAPTVDAASVGNATLSGNYTGAEDKEIEVVITRDSSDPAGAAFKWRYKGDVDFQNEETAIVANTVNELTGTGLSITWDAITLKLNDQWAFTATAAKEQKEAAYTIQSKDWGADANVVQHKLMDGTIKGSKKLVIFNTQMDTYETYDNLGALLTITYTGDQPYAALTIEDDGKGKAVKLITKIGANADEAIVDLDVALNVKSFRNIKALATYLKGFENYKVALYTAYNPELNVTDLDFMTDVNIKHTGDKTYTPVAITAVMADLQKTITTQSQLCEVVDVNRDMGIPANYEYTNLAGGSEGQSPMSWVKFLNTLAGYNVTYVVPLTDDLSIIAEVRDHVYHMSSDMGKERRMFCGRGNNLAPEAARTDAMRIAGDRVQYVYPGMYDPDDNGDIQLYPAYILAAQCAGRAAFLPDGEAMTHDHFRMSAIERELDPDQLTMLLNAGVTTFEFVMAEDVYQAGSVRMVQDITTWTEDADPLYVERAIGITADFINKDMRKALDKLLTGKRTTSATLTTARNTVLSILKERVKKEIIVAYKDVNLYKRNGAIWVDYAAAPAEPSNFVFIQSHFYSEDINAAENNTTTSAIGGKNSPLVSGTLTGEYV